MLPEGLPHRNASVPGRSRSRSSRRIRFLHTRSGSCEKKPSGARWRTRPDGVLQPIHSPQVKWRTIARNKCLVTPQAKASGASGSVSMRRLL